MNGARRRRVFVRRELWRLEATNTWDPYSLAYARAVGTMMARPANDPLSWTFQANIHGNLCQHGTWYFVSWHRSYVYWFERIVRRFVREQQNPTAPRDWALPYWNWQANGFLPPAFRARRLPDGSNNPLFTTQRFAEINAGTAGLLPATTRWNVARDMPRFSGPPQLGFGGGDSHGPRHFTGPYFGGEFEQQPHNQVHNAVGGIMQTGTSPRDPIFWAHHAMVDRLWDIWDQMRGHRNPTGDGWRDRDFQFFNEDGVSVTHRASQVLSIRGLGYRYDDSPPPVGRPVVGLLAVEPEEPAEVERRFRALGKSGPVTLTNSPGSVAVKLDDPEPVSLLSLEPTKPRNVSLVVEGIKIGDEIPAPYEVYLNLPDDDDDEEAHHDSPHFVGFLDFFGLDHEHGGDEGDGEGEEHHDAGGTRIFDVTTLMHDQSDEGGRFDADTVSVSFLPGKTLGSAETGEPIQAEHSQKTPHEVTIGSVRFVSE